MTTEQTQHARDSAELRRLCSERDQLREKVAEQAREIERLRMQLVACGVVALANTPESAAKARDMHTDYMSASCGDVIRTVDIQMQLRAELAALKAQPRGVVQWPEADEIMQMAFEEGQPSEDASGYYFELEEFDLFIQRLMEEVAHLNSSPVSAGDDRETIRAVFLRNGFTIKEGQADLKPYVYAAADELMSIARAALSAPSHGEQVRQMVEALELAQGLLRNNGFPESDPLGLGAINRAIKVSKGETL